MSTAYLSVDIDNCRFYNHRFIAAGSDKTPLKVSLICETCTDANPGKTAYAAYGVETASWGQWARRRTKKADDAIPND